MDFNTARFSNPRLRVPALLGTLGVLLLASLGLSVPVASASAPPASTDVMFVFDTSGSMGGELSEAQEKIQSVMTALSASLPNVAFGVSRVEDVPGWDKEGFSSGPLTEAEFESSSEKAWQLMAPISTNQAAAVAAINGLVIGSGGDLPESYGRALYEADTNPNVGWRAGSRHEIVLIADNVPHDPNLNEGIPSTQWARNPENETATDEVENPFNTGKEAPAKVGIPGSTWTSGTDLQIIPVAKQLAADNKPLEEVEFFGANSGYLPYWQYWAGLSGGTALEGASGELASRLTTLIEGGACGSKCPDPTTAQVICNLVIATASDTCTATVADASTTGPSNPTGAVGFASISGGTFPSGASCSLVATPASTNTSSCSVTYLPPTAPSTAPAITATYAGDAGHAGSSAKTTYPAASELEADFTLTATGTINSGVVEVPVDCGFPCAVSSSLYSGPSLGSITSVSAVSFEIAEAAGKKKKKSHKPKLLGSGTTKLSKAGKGVLKIKIARKYKHAFANIKGSVKLTLKLQTKTLGGTLVGTKTLRITLKPKKKKKSHKK